MTLLSKNKTSFDRQPERQHAGKALPPTTKACRTRGARSIHRMEQAVKR
ncbi:hypothetical protein [Limnohabitans sp.]|nr:hypothetical protein [Limnohabitans sp.]